MSKRSEVRDQRSEVREQRSEVPADVSQASPPASGADETSATRIGRPAVLHGLTLRQRGAVVEGEPVADNYQVSPAAGAADPRAPAEIVAALRAAYPRCAFTWFAGQRSEVRDQRSG